MKKAKPNPIKSIVCPGPRGWQLWNVDPSGAPSLVGEAEADQCSELQAKGEVSLYGFPAKAAFAVPIWVNSNEEEVVESAVEMHLEMQGLAPDNPAGKLVSTSQIAAEEGVEYSTDFVGTLKGYDNTSKPVVDAEGKEIRATRRYSADVGKVLARVTGSNPAYELTGKELYVRAVIASTMGTARGRTQGSCRPFPLSSTSNPSRVTVS